MILKERDISNLEGVTKKTWILYTNKEDFEKILDICGTNDDTYIDWDSCKGCNVYLPLHDKIEYFGDNEIDFDVMSASTFIFLNSKDAPQIVNPEELKDHLETLTKPDIMNEESQFIKDLENESKILKTISREGVDDFVKNLGYGTVEKYNVSKNYFEIKKLYPIPLEAFEKNQEQAKELFCKKMLDYGISNIASGTLLDSPETINFALSGLWFRVNDKIQRWKNLMFFKKNTDISVDDESLEDTFLDVCNYGNIAKIVKDGLWHK